MDKSQHYHLGFSDEAKEGHWRYVDGREVNQATVGFNGGEPNGRRSENFASMWYGTYKINDVPNNFQTPYICEFVGKYLQRKVSLYFPLNKLDTRSFITAASCLYSQSSIVCS